MSGIYPNPGKDFSSIKYPPRRGWIVVCARPGMGYVHGGYTTDKLRPCPVCGKPAVFEEDARRAAPKGERARYFIGFCPTCELRTRSAGTLKDVVLEWQNRKFSHDSILHCRRPKLDTWGTSLLCEAVCKNTFEDLQTYVRLMMDAREYSEYWQSLRGEISEIDSFFRMSPLAFALNPSAVASRLRKLLWPELTPDERLKIPLKLTEMYKGKEIAKKCIAERNLKKQQSGGDMLTGPSSTNIVKTTKRRYIRKKI